MVLWNVRSIVNNLKVHFVTQTLKDCKVDIACITESWLDPDQGHNHTISIIESLGFTVSFSPRKNRRGGGVAILLRSHIQFVPIQHTAKYNSLEWHGIRLFGKQTSYIVFSVFTESKKYL